MFMSSLNNCEAIISGDRAVLRELLHPDKTPLKVRYSLAHATVRPGATTLPHRLKSAEVYYTLAGKGLVHINGESAEVHADDAVYIPPDARQYIQNTGDSDLIFLCIVDPAWQAEDEEVL